MTYKLTDYEGFEAYAKGVRDKYAIKKDIITPQERKQLQLHNEGYIQSSVEDISSLLYCLFINTAFLLQEKKGGFFSFIDELVFKEDGSVKDNVELDKITKLELVKAYQQNAISQSYGIMIDKNSNNISIEKLTDSNLSVYIPSHVFNVLWSEYDVNQTVGLMSMTFVAKEKGKSLSTNDYTNEDKQKVNNIPDNPKYTDTIPDLSGYAKKGEASSSKSATFVIANYDSSENSKLGADYIIKENESPCDVINSFVAKLPSYGGKIQLTEGHFIEKDNKSINLNKNNITLSGYGQSTNLERTVEDSKVDFIKIINSNIILENFQSNTKSYTAVSLSGDTNKCKLLNVSGTASLAVFDIEGTSHQISNCSGVSTTFTFYTEGSKHQLLNCSGISVDSSAFYIDGSLNSLVGCTGETTLKKNYTCFAIMGSNNQLSNCSGISVDSSAFYIKGLHNRLSNCSGTSTNLNAVVVNGSNNQLSNCSGISTNRTSFDILGSGNSLVGCFGENNPKKSFACFNTQGSNNQISNCLGVSTMTAFYIEGANNRLSNCSGTSTNVNAFQIDGSQISVIGCFGETKKPDIYGDIFFTEKSNKCIGLGLQYHNHNALVSKGTDNILANNISIK